MTGRVLIKGGHIAQLPGPAQPAITVRKAARRYLLPPLENNWLLGACDASH